MSSEWRARAGRRPSPGTVARSATIVGVGTGELEPEGFVDCAETLGVQPPYPTIYLNYYARAELGVALCDPVEVRVSVLNRMGAEVGNLVWLVLIGLIGTVAALLGISRSVGSWRSWPCPWSHCSRLGRSGRSDRELIELRPIWMHSLIPETGKRDFGEMAEQLLRSPQGSRRPYLACSFISTLDGRATVSGSTERLGFPTDGRALMRLRTFADAVIIGGGTMRVERYDRMLPVPRLREYREQIGLVRPANRDRQPQLGPALGRGTVQRRPR